MRFELRFAGRYRARIGRGRLLRSADGHGQRQQNHTHLVKYLTKGISS
jgi:hypothetical protein